MQYSRPIADSQEANALDLMITPKL